MAQFTINDITLKGIAASVPKNTALNSDLSFFSTDELEKLIATLGIKKRRVSLPHQCATDLCIAAAEKLIDKLNWNKDDIDVLVFVSQTPDYQLPGSSLHIQHRLGLSKSCLAIDINQGCAGYVYGLSVISSLMSAAKIKKGLLLVGDTITKIISPFDKSILPLFSDCGTTTALEYDEEAKPILFNISSEGENYDSIIVPAGGGRNPITEDSFEFKKFDGNIERKDFHLKLKGLDVFNFSLKKVVPNIEDLIAFSNNSKEAIDFYVFHQANLLIVNTLGKKLDLPLEKAPISLEEYGNTSSASIPLTLVTNVAKENKIINQNILFAGFGVGLSLGSAIVNFNNVICPDLIELE